MTAASNTEGQTPPTPTGRLSAARHDLLHASATRRISAVDDRRHSERPPPRGPGSLYRDQPSEFLTHLAVALTRHARRLRQDRLSVPPAIDELASVLVHCARMRPAATLMDEEELATQDGAVARRLLVTKAEAAEYLSVSVRTVERLVAAGQLPLLHIERASRLRLVDLEAYVDSLIPVESAESAVSDEA